MIPSPYLMLLGAWEALDNMRLNIAERLQVEKPPEIPNVTGKVYVVTGASAGVGRATVEALAARGAHVVMAVRSVEKGNRVAKEVLDNPVSKKSDPVIEVQELDLGSLDSVKQFTKAFNSRKMPVDVLICNAGIMAPPKRLQTKDGLEEQMQVNYLSHWLLAHELLTAQRKLRRTGQTKNHMTGTRVVMVTSMTHHGAKIDFSDLQSQREYRPFQAYANSKAMNIIAAKEFQRRIDRNVQHPGDVEDCTVSVHPGLVDTGLARGFFRNAFPPLKLILDVIFPVILRSPQAAALTVLYAATAPTQKVKGGYIEGKALHEPAAITHDPEVAQQLWGVSCQYTGISTSLELT